MALDSNMVIPAHVALILDGNGQLGEKKEVFLEPLVTKKAVLQ